MDLYLNIPLHGGLKTNKSNFEKDKFELAIDKEIEGLIEDEESALPNPMISKDMKKMKLKKNLQENDISNKLNNHIQDAIQLIYDEKGHHLSEEEFQLIESDLVKASLTLEELDLDIINYRQNIHEILSFSDETLQIMHRLATDKFQEKCYRECLAIMVFLSTLEQNNSEQWFHLGIAAHKNEDPELAIEAYTAAISLDPKIVGARLLASECFLTLNKKQNALELIDEVRNLSLEEELNPEWQQLFYLLNEYIKDGSYGR